MGKGLNLAENEVSARDDALLYHSISLVNGVFQYGNRMSHEIVSANKVNIKDGMLQIQGRNYVIYPNDIEQLAIENGVQGTKRYDLIVCQFTKTGSVETMQLKVVKGTASASPKDPVLTQDDTLASGKTYQLPLYRIKLNGINIEGVDDLRTFIPSLKKSLQVISEGDGYIEVDYIK